MGTIGIDELPQSSPAVPPTPVSGPQLVDQFRVQMEPGLTAVFPLVGQIDFPARIEVIVLEGNIDPVILISNNAGDLLATIDNTGRGEPEVIGQFQFPGDGYYELGLQADDERGELGISVYRLNTAVVEGGGVFDGVNQELRGTIEHPSTYHTFRLPLERGQRVDIAAVANTEGLDLLFELYGPDGTLLLGRDDNVGVDPYLWNFMPRQSGTYTIVLRNFDENLGDYTIQVISSESAGAAIVGTRTSMELISSPRRSSWLTLDGKALDAIRIEARSVDSGMDLLLAVYDPYGNPLVTVNQFGVNAPEQATMIQFPFDGTYQVEFLTLGEGGQIEYLIRRTGAADLDMGGRIAPSRAAQEGEIVGPGTVIAYLIDAEAGDLIGVDAQPADERDGLNLAFDLYDPNGFLVVSRDDVVGLNPIIDGVELIQSGRYALLLRNVNGTTGAFNLFVSNPTAPGAPPLP